MKLCLATGVPQVGENDPYLFNLRPNIPKSWHLITRFIPNDSNLIG